MKKLLCIISLLSTFAQAEIITYEVEEGDNLDKIIAEKLGEDELTAVDRNMAVYQIKRYNPNIKDWNHITEGMVIMLSPPLAPNVSNFAHAYLHAACNINHKFYKENPQLKPEQCH